jgi:hypothetical protein
VVIIVVVKAGSIREVMAEEVEEQERLMIILLHQVLVIP